MSTTATDERDESGTQVTVATAPPPQLREAVWMVSSSPSWTLWWNPRRDASGLSSGLNHAFQSTSPSPGERVTPLNLVLTGVSVG
mmetsp:Transcript_57839/g.154188  ORF Transcript_57839/g.154188 Transcript_57839/m.154188 type:complete len:85 (+) Transcript_57839:734-988(+)